MEELKITLAAARVNAGLTQDEAAKRLGITRNTIIKWENGQTKPGTVQVIALANVYSIPVENIFLPGIATYSCVVLSYG